jgi:hypothetical protein
VNGDEAVLRDMRDGETDHVEVGDEREQRPFSSASRDEVADGV